GAGTRARGLGHPGPACQAIPTSRAPLAGPHWRAPLAGPRSPARMPLSATNYPPRSTVFGNKNGITARNRGDAMNRWRRTTNPRGLVTAAGAAALVLGIAAAGNAPARAAVGVHAGNRPGAVLPGQPGPRGFWYGTDSFPVTVSGSAPYAEPQIGGKYGGYIGMTGN